MECNYVGCYLNYEWFKLYDDGSISRSVSKRAGYLVSPTRQRWPECGAGSRRFTRRPRIGTWLEPGQTRRPVPQWPMDYYCWFWRWWGGLGLSWRKSWPREEELTTSVVPKEARWRWLGQCHGSRQWRCNGVLEWWWEGGDGDWSWDKSCRLVIRVAIRWVELKVIIIFDTLHEYQKHV